MTTLPEPMMVRSIRRDMKETPSERGGILRHFPATPGWGGSGCPGDNLVADWDDAVRVHESQVAALEGMLQAVKALHHKVPDVHVDNIHRGLTPVYGDGCDECRTAWPCGTAKALGVTE